MSKKSLDLVYIAETLKVQTGLRAGQVISIPEYGIPVTEYGIPGPFPDLEVS